MKDQDMKSPVYREVPKKTGYLGGQAFNGQSP